MNEEAKLFSALSDPVRLEILNTLIRRKGCVSQIQLATGKNQPNISQHLRVLRQAGIVESKKDGQRVCYSICKREVKQLLKLAKRI